MARANGHALFAGTVKNRTRTLQFEVIYRELARLSLMFRLNGKHTRDQRTLKTLLEWELAILTSGVEVRRD